MRDIPGTTNISYHKKDDRYSVSKSINGKLQHLGGFKTLIGALMIKDWCEANQWKPYPNNRNKSSGEKYIHYRENLDVYEIIKSINGHNEYFGRYHTLTEAKKWRDYFIEQDWDINQRLIGTINKNIYFKLGKYRIIKHINGKDYMFGSFNTLTEAEKRLHEIRLKGWMNVINDNERLLETTVSNIIQIPNGKFEIVKNIDGVKHTFGVFNTLEEAEDEVKLLRKSNWDYDALCESHDETNNGETEWLTGDVKLKSSFTKLSYRDDSFSYTRQNKLEYQQKLKKYGVKN